jgi:hypothetical protein
VAPPNGKAIFVTNTDITLDRLEFSGTQVPDANGAGIRYQGGHLVITNSSFHDNQNGLLAADAPAGSITIRNTEFSRNGTGDGRTHNLYVGHVGTLTIENSSFHDAVVGHQIKSRADTTVIRDSHIYDGATGTGSYSIDLPNGGRAVLTGNLIEQGAASQNPVIVAFGEEGNVHPNSRLEMSGNTISNELVSVSTRLVWNATGTTAELTGNQVFGLSAGQYANGPVQISGMTVLAAEPVAAGLGVAATTRAAEVLPALVETAAPAAAEVALPAVVLPEPVAPALPVAAPAESAVGDRPAAAPSEAEAAPLPVVTPPAPDPPRPSRRGAVRARGGRAGAARRRRAARFGGPRQRGAGRAHARRGAGSRPGGAASRGRRRLGGSDDGGGRGADPSRAGGRGGDAPGHGARARFR